MTISHLLEDFGDRTGGGDVLKLISDVALEDQRLASFEQGYSAGWEDALEAQERDRTRITGKLLDSLGDMSFTYHEAVGQMMDSLEPVFCALVERVLPELLFRSFGHHIVEQLGDMARERMTGPAVIAVPPGSGAALAPLLSGETLMPVEISEDDTLAEGQAVLRLGSCEREVDCTALLDSIRESVEAFTHQTQSEARHG